MSRRRPKLTTKAAAQRWMRKLETQRTYWERNKRSINERRRRRYAAQQSLLKGK